MASLKFKKLCQTANGVERDAQISLLRHDLCKVRRKIKEADKAAAKGERLRSKAEMILIDISRLENGKT